MLCPSLRKIPSTSAYTSRILSRCSHAPMHVLRPSPYQEYLASSLHQHQRSEFCATTKARQAKFQQRQREAQLQEMLNRPSVAGEPHSPPLRAVYPGDLSDDEDEYIPEVDWDHTRFEKHYKRIWDEQPEPESRREKVYNFLLRNFFFLSCLVAVGCVSFGAFAWYKMRRQLKYVRGTQRNIRYMRKIYDKHLSEIAALLPFESTTMDVAGIKAMVLPLCTEGTANVSLDALKEKCGAWQALCELGLPLNDLVDYDKDNCMDVQDVTYFLAMMHYFLGQTRRKGTPSVRRQVRDDVYKMLQSYSDDGKVTLANMGSYASACFSLAIISPPNLGHEKIGGQNLDEFKVNYCRYMLRDETMQMDDEISVRKFNFLYKICDFSIGLTPETRGQLAK